MRGSWTSPGLWRSGGTWNSDDPDPDECDLKSEVTVRVQCKVTQHIRKALQLQIMKEYRAGGH